MWPAVIGAVGSIATSAANAKFSSREASHQRSWQERMWHMQNAYNDPSAMANRMRAAGLNPFQMTGAEPAGSAGSGASASGMPFTNPVDSIINSLVGASSADKNRADSGLSDARVMETVAKIKLLEQEFQTGKITQTEYNARLQQLLEFIAEGGNIYKDSSRVANSQADSYDADVAYKSALTHSENVLRDLKADQMEQNIKESKALVNKLSAEEKKLLRETESVDNLVERQEIVNACSAFYGFPVYDLPPTLTAQLVETYTLVVRGEIYPETALRSVGRLIEEYKNKELHIPRSRSQSVSTSESRAILSVKGSKSSQNSWSETY